MDKDSTSITQDDNTINATDNEVSDEPLFEKIQNQRLKDASIKEYKGCGNSVSSGKYCIEMKYGNGIRYYSELSSTQLTNNTKGG